jgi:hypothetical protein
MQPTLLARLTDGLRRRRFGFFFAELVLVVAGILIALAIDGWVGDRKDSEVELTYLELLARDIDELRAQADEQLQFEQDKVAASTTALRLMNNPDPAAHREELGRLLAFLTGRRTVSLSSATYEQMLSSGHLQLIRNTTLRDSIVRHFARLERLELIIGKNNQDLIDDVYIPFMLRAGISQRPDMDLDRGRSNRGPTLMQDALGPDFEYPGDTVLEQPPEAASWKDIQRHVMWRMYIAALGQANAEAILEETGRMAAELQAELDRR